MHYKMVFTIADIIQIVILIGGICVSIGVWKNELKNLKKKHKDDFEHLDYRMCKHTEKIDKMEIAIVDLKWIKEAVSEIKLDIKTLKK